MGRVCRVHLGVPVLVAQRHRYVAALQNHVVLIFLDILVHIMNVQETRGRSVLRIVQWRVLVIHMAEPSIMGEVAAALLAHAQ